jgi:predicted nucleic acid-binding protein
VTLVLDASAAVELVLATERGLRVADRLPGEDLLAPELLDAECVSALARLERAGAVTAAEGDAAVRALLTLPLTRVSHLPLTGAAWSLRDRVRTADGFYVACARWVKAPLLTCDRRLAAAAVPELVVLLV